MEQLNIYPGGMEWKAEFGEVNTPRVTNTGRYSIYLPRRDGRLSWPCWLDSAPAGSRTSDLSITSPTPNDCITRKTTGVCKIFLVGHKNKFGGCPRPSLLCGYVTRNLAAIFLSFFLELFLEWLGVFLPTSLLVSGSLFSALYRASHLLLFATQLFLLLSQLCSQTFRSIAHACIGIDYGGRGG